MRRLIDLVAAMAWLEARTAPLGVEWMPPGAALGRVLAGEVMVGPLPCSAEAAFDGWAVVAALTEGAGGYAPVMAGGCAVVAGEALPPGTDAVVPLAEVEAGMVLAAVARGHGVVAPGYDVAAGTLLAEGTVLGARHIGLLGDAAVAVVRRPGVRVLEGGAMVTALVAAAGGVEGDDLVIGGLDECFAEGVAMQPGEATSLGWVGGRVAVRLPRDAVGCLAAFAVLVGPALRRMGGLEAAAARVAVLGRKVVSGLGVVEVVAMRLEAGVAWPMRGGLWSQLGADGYLVVPEGSEGYPAGASVPILPL